MAGVTNARPSDGRDDRNTISRDFTLAHLFLWWDGVTYPQICGYAMKPSAVTVEVDLAIAPRAAVNYRSDPVPLLAADS